MTFKKGDTVKCVQHDSMMEVVDIDVNNITCHFIDQETICSEIYNIEDLRLIHRDNRTVVNYAALDQTYVQEQNRLSRMAYGGLVTFIIAGIISVVYKVFFT